MHRTVKFKGKQVTLDLYDPVYRYKDNPIITCHDVNSVWDDPKLQVITVHNAGVTKYRGEFIMLFRSHLRNGVSVIGLARSEDGIRDWEIEDEPVLMPATKTDRFAEPAKANDIIKMEAGGVEDPRISKIRNTFYITYSAYSATVKNKVRVCVATTLDFKKFVRHGTMLKVDMRNVVIFPKRINDVVYALFRPNDDIQGDVGGIYKQIKIGYATNVTSANWNIRKDPVIQIKDGPSAFCDKIGPGATPIKTKHGWISIFHGVRTTMDGNPYVLGVALHDIKKPEKVKYSTIPILFPTWADCCVGREDYVHVPNVVFTCGAVRRDDGTIYIYYGGNDTVMNLCISHEDILAELCNY
jgi:predicted GH43/DUF377 family glycosyl hydrolase